MLLEKCQAQELSLEEVDLLTDKCSNVEVELKQLHTDLDAARYVESHCLLLIITDRIVGGNAITSVCPSVCCHSLFGTN